MQSAVDVAIVGAGPAGCATALSLRTHSPTLSIGLIEQASYETARPGEVLPGIARGVLENLGIWEAFERQQWRPVYAVASAWGAPVLRENHAIYSWPGHGWHLDRVRFDGFLAQQAEGRGVAVLTGVRVDGAARTECGWHLDISAGAPIHARFIVDATGRNASVARRFGAVPVSLDPLVGFSRFFSAGENSDPRTLIEAAADGWWYTAALTGSQRVATFMTDPDIARQYRLDRESSWREALEQTRFICGAVPAQPACGEMVRPAGSAYLEEPAGDGWIAAGDAACAHDPLSGQGITRSLRSGILAAYAISDIMRNRSASSLDRYRRLMQHGWSGYLAARRRYYLEEQRWPERSFWRRRHAQVQAEPASFSASTL
jgi:flavin-dependent dehydrogenase